MTFKVTTLRPAYPDATPATCWPEPVPAGTVHHFEDENGAKSHMWEPPQGAVLTAVTEIECDLDQWIYGLVYTIEGQVFKAQLTLDGPLLNNFAEPRAKG